MTRGILGRWFIQMSKNTAAKLKTEFEANSKQMGVCPAASDTRIVKPPAYSVSR